MIIRIEPFRHGHGLPGLDRQTAACHGKIAFQFRRILLETETGRLAPQQLDMIEHMIVIGKITNRHPILPGLLLQCPVSGPQLFTHFDQFFEIRIRIVRFGCTFPVRFKRRFQFPLRPHARKTQNMTANHEFIPFKTSLKNHSQPCNIIQMKVFSIHHKIF